MAALQGPARRLRRHGPGLPASRACSPTPCRSTPIAAPAGRKSIYLIERLIDAAARELGLDPIEFRRRNFIRREPHAVQDRGRRDLRFRRVRQGHGRRAEGRPTGRASASAGREAASRGRLRGIGMSYYIESTMGDPEEAAKIQFERRRHGHASWSAPSPTARATRPPTPRSLTDRLGIPFEKIRIVQGDTEPAQVGRRHRRLALADRRGHGDPATPPTW